MCITLILRMHSTPFDTLASYGNLYGLASLLRFVDLYTPTYGTVSTVRVNGCYSEKKKLHRGVPQGSVVGPYLFNLFMRELPNSEPCSYLQYADDTAITAVSLNEESAARKLQRAVGLVSGWFKKWKLDLKAEKCATMLYSRRCARSLTINVTLNDVQIEWTDR